MARRCGHRCLDLPTAAFRLLDVPIKRWRAGPIEVEYAEAVAAIAEAVVRADEPQRSAALSVEQDADLQRVASFAERGLPDVAIIKGFGLVKRELRMLASDAGLDSEKSSPAVLAAELADAGVITAESVSAIRGIDTLRNLAVHGHDS